MDAPEKSPDPGISFPMLETLDVFEQLLSSNLLGAEGSVGNTARTGTVRALRRSCYWSDQIM